MPRYQFSAPVSAPGSAIAASYARSGTAGNPLSVRDFARVLPGQHLGQQGQLEESHVPRLQALGLVRNDLIIAAGWGVDSTVSEATRSVYSPAIPQAWAPPQSWPTMCARSMPGGVQQGDDVRSGLGRGVVPPPRRSCGR